MLTKGKHGTKISLWGGKEEAGDREGKTEAGRESVDPEASGTHHTVKTVVSVLSSLQKSATQSSKGQCVIIWGLVWFLSCLF